MGEDGEGEDDVMFKCFEVYLFDNLIFCGVFGVECVFLMKGCIFVQLVDGFQFVVRDDECCMQWYLDISGIVLCDVFGVEGVDIKRIYINDLWQIVEVFGIEVVCFVFVCELIEVLVFDGLYVNYWYIVLLVDVMIY